MPKCGECRLLVADKKGGYRCASISCVAAKITPETDAGACLRFIKK